MKTFGKLLIPLGLGCLAFVLNWLAVQPQLGHDFVRVTENVPLDTPLTESEIERFKVVGDNFENLKKTLVPWEERAAILGLPIRRELKAHDFVFWQDVRYLSADFLARDDEIPLHISLEGVDYEPSLLKVGNEIGLVVPVAPPQPEGAESNPANVFNELSARFEELGPFRILSVGQRTLEAPGESDLEDTDRGNTHIVTLAVKLDEAEQDQEPTAVVTGADGKPAAAKKSVAPTSRPIPEAARKLLAARNARYPDGKNFVGMVLYQDVEKLRRLRELQAEVNAKANPTGTGAK